MEPSCLFCLEQIKENRMMNPIGCQCTLQAHTHCFEQWFQQKNQMECPICHTVSVPNRMVMDTVHVVYIQTPQVVRQNPMVGHEKAAAFCCCLLLGWPVGITILNMVMGH